MPWLVGMTYKAVRTDRHKYIHWVNKSRDHELDELYDLDSDPFELRNLVRSRRYAGVVGLMGGSPVGEPDSHVGLRVAAGIEFHGDPIAKPDQVRI